MCVIYCLSFVYNLIMCGILTFKLCGVDNDRIVEAYQCSVILVLYFQLRLTWLPSLQSHWYKCTKLDTITVLHTTNGVSCARYVLLSNQQQLLGGLMCGDWLDIVGGVAAMYILWDKCSVYWALTPLSIPNIGSVITMCMVTTLG